MVLKYNKRGDVPTTILVIGVFVVCGLAIVSFFYTGMVLSNSFEGVDVLENANIKIEQGNLNHYKDEILKNKFSLSSDFDFVRKVVVFSVEFFGG